MMKPTLFAAAALALIFTACNKPPAAPAQNQQGAAQNASAVVPPRLIHGVQASFPEELWSKPGTVTVAAVVGVEGKVTETKIVTSPHPELNQLASDSVKQWTFEPAKKAGQAVPFTVTVNVNFAPPKANAPAPAASAQKPQK